jgi:tetratricopeptide (TPR) repeat protein
MPPKGKEFDSPTPGARLGSAGWIIFAAAFAVRALHLWQLADSPFLDVRMGDAASYDAWARHIAAGNWLGSEIFYQAPLYPYFLGGIYAILGDHPLVFRACQALLDALSCVLLADVATRLWGRTAGVLAGGMLAVYAPAIFFDGLIQKSALDLVLLCALLSLVFRLAEAPRGGLATATGIAAGALMLSRENALVFAACIAIWIALRERSRPPRAAVLLGAFVAGMALVLVPVGIRNQVVGGEFHLTTSQFGPNFFIGNNPGANGRYRPLLTGGGSAAVERRDATELAERAVGRSLTPAEVSRFWANQAIAWIAAEPAAWLRLLALKLAMTWDAVESIDTEDQYTVAEWSLPLRISNSIFHFGILAPLAVMGMWVTWRQRERLWLLYGMVAAYTASVVLFYVFARYRYPLVPLLMLFAAGGIAGFGRFARERPLPQVLGCVALTLAVALFSNNVQLASKEQMRAVTYFNLGNAARVDGDLRLAVERYRVALGIEPTYADARHNLALTLLLMGEPDEAIELHQTRLIEDPTDLRALVGLAAGFHAVGRLDEATATHRRALEIDPRFVNAHVGLALALAESGDRAAARTHLLTARELVDESDELQRAQIAELLRRLDELEAAEPSTVGQKEP